jgi:hypothetical protein
MSWESFIIFTIGAGILVYFYMDRIFDYVNNMTIPLLPRRLVFVKTWTVEERLIHLGFRVHEHYDLVRLQDLETCVVDAYQKAYKKNPTIREGCFSASGLRLYGIPLAVFEDGKEVAFMDTTIYKFFTRVGIKPRP